MDTPDKQITDKNKKSTEGSVTPSNSIASFCSKTQNTIGRKRSTTEVVKFKFECLGSLNPCSDENKNEHTGLLDCANIYRQKGIPCSHIITAYRYIYLKSIQKAISRKTSPVKLNSDNLNSQTPGTKDKEEKDELSHQLIQDDEEEKFDEVEDKIEDDDDDKFSPEKLMNTRILNDTPSFLEAIDEDDLSEYFSHQDVIFMLKKRWICKYQ